jgi:metal-sulfur cluster biosynthetic enzyme
MRDTSKLSENELKVLQVIKTVIDPEVGVNIVDIGLIYHIDFNEDEKRIHVLMTLSARGCPVGDTIINQVEMVVKAYWNEYIVDVELTWEPQWNPSMITDEGQAALG